MNENNAFTQRNAALRYSQNQNGEAEPVYREFGNTSCQNQQPAFFANNTYHDNNYGYQPNAGYASEYGQGNSYYAPPYVPSPEEKRRRQIKYEKKLVRRLGNRSGWAIVITIVLMELIATGIMCFYNASPSGTEYSCFLELANAVVSFIGMFCGGVFLILISDRKMREVITFSRKKSRKRCAAMLFIGLSAIPLCNYFTQIIADNLSFIGIHQKSYGIQTGNVEITFFYVAVEILCTAVVPAISEEFLFRGAILGVLKPYGEGFAIAMSALLFGLVHGNLTQIPFAVLGGIFFGYVRVYTGSLIFPMILHAANNLLSVVLDIINLACPQTVLGTNYNISDIVINAYYPILLIFSFVLLVALAKRDSSFCRLERPKSLISEKQKAISYIASPGFIVFFCMIIIETIANYFLS